MSSFRRRLMMMQGGGKSALEPCIYATTSANQSVQIIYKKEYAQRIYLEDGTELDVSGTGTLNYAFPNAGDHKVWIKFKEDATNFNDCFYNCKGLTSIPENLFANNTAVTTFNNCFRDCSGLPSIPANLFANNTAVTNFSYCFGRCTSLTSSCPVDNDGTPIYNRSSGKSGYSKVTSYRKCFLNCTNMADYSSIPSGWK